ncbi:hypothetical protein EDB80DRAFT_32454 [Ilyonectria destructans]|nr:hypothetical protein EDB80DRAFT_32454 [Ilyonectria destructans]
MTTQFLVCRVPAGSLCWYLAAGPLTGLPLALFWTGASKWRAQPRHARAQPVNLLTCTLEAQESTRPPDHCSRSSAHAPWPMAHNFRYPLRPHLAYALRGIPGRVRLSFCLSHTTTLVPFSSAAGCHSKGHNKIIALRTAWQGETHPMSG